MQRQYLFILRSVETAWYEPGRRVSNEVPRLVFSHFLEEGRIAGRKLLLDIGKIMEASIEEATVTAMEKKKKRQHNNMDTLPAKGISELNAATL